MTINSPLLAQLVSDPTSPPERVILPKRDLVRAANFSELEEWQRSVERYAFETAADRQPLHVLDFSVHDLLIKDLLNKYYPMYLWPEDLYIPGNADYRNYWFTPCPDDHRYSRQWIIGNDVNKANAGDGHVWAYTALNQYVPHARSEAGIGFLYTPSTTLAVYQVKPSLSNRGGPGHTAPGHGDYILSDFAGDQKDKKSPFRLHTPGQRLGGPKAISYQCQRILPSRRHRQRRHL
jgi:hypothetical protein